MRRAVAAVVAALVAWGLVTIGPGGLPPALACTVAPAPADPALAEQQSFDRATVVFEGVALSSNDPPTAGGRIPSSGDPVFFTFAADRLLKGAPGPRPVVSTARSSASCGVTFAMGVRYRVFATGPVEALTTSLGSGTREAPLSATTTTAPQNPPTSAPPPSTPPRSVAPPATPRSGVVRLTG